MADNDSLSEEAKEATVAPSSSSSSTSTSTSPSRWRVKEVNWVRFSPNIEAFLIPTRKEYTQLRLFHDLYYTGSQMEEMKQSALSEIRAYMAEHELLSAREAARLLYQPDIQAGCKINTVGDDIFKRFLTDDCLIDSVIDTARYCSQRMLCVSGRSHCLTNSEEKEFLLETDAPDELHFLVSI